MKLASAALAVSLAIAACDRVVIYELDPDRVLPPAYEILETTTYTPSGRGTEYRSTYWLIGVPESITQDEALDEVALLIGNTGLDRIVRNGAEGFDRWWEVEFTNEGNNDWVAIGTHQQFARSQLDLGPIQLESFQASGEAHPGGEIVLLSVPG
jgi:hypothetical protein